MPHMAVSGAYLTARWILGAVYRAPAKADHLGGTMGTDVFSSLLTGLGGTMGGLAVAVAMAGNRIYAGRREY